jgi:hypothetical protein
VVITGIAGEGAEADRESVDGGVSVGLRGFEQGLEVLAGRIAVAVAGGEPPDVDGGLEGELGCWQVKRPGLSEEKGLPPA